MVKSKFVLKLTSLILVFTMAITVISHSVVFASGVSISNVVFTEKEKEIMNKGLTPELIKQINTELANYETPIRMESRSVQTKAVKAAIKAVLANKNKLINTVAKYVDKDAAIKVGAALNTITPALNKLLSYQELAYGTVEGLVKNALVSAGMSNSAASSLAYWVRVGLEWLV